MIRFFYAHLVKKTHTTQSQARGDTKMTNGRRQFSKLLSERGARVENCFIHKHDGRNSQDLEEIVA